MISLAIIAGLFFTLFALSFATKRRFGILGLSLAAGSLLSTNWTDTLTPFIAQHVTLVAPPLASLVAAGLILAPAFLLLLSGPTYSAFWPRFLGSVAFALLAMAFLFTPLGAAVNFDGTGQQIYTQLGNYQGILIVAGLISAIVDILFTRSRHKKEKKHKG